MTTTNYINSKVMKTIISISSIINEAVSSHEIPYHISLDDASRMFANAEGPYLINPDIFYSARVRAYQKGDQIVSVGRKRLNVSELRRVLEQFVGRGPVTIWVKSRIITGDLIK